MVTPPLQKAASAASEIARDAAGNVLPAAPPGPLGGLASFGQQIFNFAIVALTAFVIAKLINRLKRALEARAQQVSPHAEAELAVEDPAVRQIAQNERIIALLEEMVKNRPPQTPNAPQS